MMNIRPEVLPFIVAVFAVFGILVAILRVKGVAWKKLILACGVPSLILAAYFLYFFRDPERRPPDVSDAVLAGADGKVSSITEVYEERYLGTNCVRISIYLSLFDVHVNRAPISGISSFLGYFPGKHLFTIQEKSSEVNQHNKFLINGELTRCLVCQIVGPVCRRVVYWLPHDKACEVAAGDRIGMMKFGSRLDMYLPAGDVTVSVKPGDVTRAGETIVARVKAAKK